MEEELEEMQSTSRFDFSVLRNPKFLLYLAYVILHAGGMLTIIILQPRYIEETKNMTGKMQKKTRPGTRLPQPHAGGQERC